LDNNFGIVVEQLASLSLTEIMALAATVHCSDEAEIKI
jgi:hypothetical protein